MSLDKTIDIDNLQLLETETEDNPLELISSNADALLSDDKSIKTSLLFVSKITPLILINCYLDK